MHVAVSRFMSCTRGCAHSNVYRAKRELTLSGPQR